MKKKSLIIVLICIGGMLMLFSGIKSLFKHNVPLSGGKIIKTDPHAPKEIKSDEIINFSISFFRYGDFYYEEDRNYSFKMTVTDDGKYIITEDSNEILQCETDKEFAVKLQKIISDNQFVQLNGTWEKTSGLPPEFEPYNLAVVYASNEKLNVHKDNNPHAEWTFDILDLFAREFDAHGISDLVPAKETSTVTRFSLEFAYDNVRHTYSEIYVPITEEEKQRDFEDIATNGYNLDNCQKMAYAQLWDRDTNTKISETRSADLSEEHYKALSEIAINTDLKRFDNGQICPPGFDYNSPQYYEFYIEFESGNRLIGHSNDPEQCQLFKEIAEQFSDYYLDFVGR